MPANDGASPLRTPPTLGEDVRTGLSRETLALAIVENLRDLHLLSARFLFSCFPLSLPGLDGAPVRATAIVED